MVVFKGIGYKRFKFTKTHSFRGATILAAYMTRVLTRFLTTANWASAKTFHKFLIEM